MKQTSEHDLHLGKWLGGAALGALAMYMMDPDRGAPRRALSGAKLRDLGRQGGDMLEKVVQGVGERLSAGMPGVAAAIAGADAGRSNDGHGASTPDEGRNQQGAVDSDQRGSDSPGGNGHRMRAAKKVAEIASADGRRGTFSLWPLWPSSPRDAAMLGGGTLGVASMLMRRMPFAMAVGMAGTALLMRSMRQEARSNQRPEVL